jgi:uncharacterized protein (DUF2062 family)
MNPRQSSPFQNYLFRSRPLLRWVFKLRSTPRAIAGGLGLGMFIAFTPTVGIQIILAVFAATMLGLNRPAAIIPVWITNPLTVAPIYLFNYWIGIQIWGGPPVSEVSGTFYDLGRTLTSFHLWEIKDQLLITMNMGWNILVPLLIGSIIVGIVTGVVTYVVTLKLLFLLFRRRAQKRILYDKK